MLKRWLSSISSAASRPQFILGALLVSAFLLGGSARPEVSSLPALRAAAALVLGLGLATLGRRQMKAYAPLVALAVACVILPLVQVIPLPPGMANALPGHALVAQIDAQADIGAVWRPLTLTPQATRNALWSLLIPCAALTMAIQISPQGQKRVAALVLALGVISGVLGLLQIQSDNRGVLYFYDTTNNGAAVGLFANRNHEAVFLACLLPLLFAISSFQRSERLPVPPRRSLARRLSDTITVSVALLLVLLIIVTGSRAGLAMGVLGLACAPCVASNGVQLRGGSSSGSGRLAFALACSAIGIVIALAVWQRRAVALDRLLSTDPAEEMRLLILPTVEQMTLTFWPWGSGLGSFEKVYQVYEPAELLAPFYMNHAHNDWIELALTGGFPALALLVAGCAIWTAYAFKVALARNPGPIAPLRKAGLAIVLILSLASLSDYPLRTPALSCLLVLAAVWAAMPSPQASDVPGAHKPSRS